MLIAYETLEVIIQSERSTTGGGERMKRKAEPWNRPEKLAESQAGNSTAVEPEIPTKAFISQRKHDSQSPTVLSSDSLPSRVGYQPWGSDIRESAFLDYK